MKTIFLIFAVICGTNAALGNDIVNFQDTITQNLKNTEESITSDLHYITVAVQNAPQVLVEFVKDLFTTIFQFTKVEPRVPLVQMIQAEGYPAESHYVTTNDGYILNVYRIPHGKTNKRRGKVVYLQHGNVASSSDYVFLGPKRSLAYILADDGYDVWMGNARGNYYSRNHTKWNPDKDPEFWNFSFHEVGISDLPTMIDYCLKKTGNTSLFYAGHSQGTTSFFVMASMRSEYNAKIKHHISLSPIIFMNHLFSPLIRLSAPFVNAIYAFAQFVGINEIPPPGIATVFSQVFCSASVGQAVCKYGTFLGVGASVNQVNVLELSRIITYVVAGTSTKSLAHYGQEVNSGRFCQYDYSPSKNQVLYNSTTPPDYDLSKVTAPVTLIYSGNDWFSAMIDVDRLGARLPNLKEKFLVPVPTFNHLDYLYGKDAPAVVYKKIVDTYAGYA